MESPKAESKQRRRFKTTPMRGEPFVRKPLRRPSSFQAAGSDTDTDPEVANFLRRTASVQQQQQQQQPELPSPGPQPVEPIVMPSFETQLAQREAELALATRWPQEAAKMADLSRRDIDKLEAAALSLETVADSLRRASKMQAAIREEQGEAAQEMAEQRMQKLLDREATLLDTLERSPARSRNRALGRADQVEAHIEHLDSLIDAIRSLRAPERSPSELELVEARAQDAQRIRKALRQARDRLVRYASKLDEYRDVSEPEASEGSEAETVDVPELVSSGPTAGQQNYARAVEKLVEKYGLPEDIEVPSS